MSIMISDVGTPIITVKGDLVKLVDFEAFKQRLLNLFNTQVGSHLMFPLYGFNALTLKNVEQSEIERTMYALVINALNPENVEGLDRVLYVDVTYANQVCYVEISVMSKYGQRYINTLGVAI